MKGLKYVIALLAVGGLYVSSRALEIHYMDPSQAPPCAVSANWDCGYVNHSKFSEFPPYPMESDFDADGHLRPPTGIHIPVATIGIIGYALILIAALAGRLRIVLELSRIGFFCAAFLSYIEAYIITKWCIYCVWSLCIITTILVLSIISTLMRRRRRAESMIAVLTAED